MPHNFRLHAKGFLYCFVFSFIQFGSLMTEKNSVYTLISEKVAVLYGVCHQLHVQGCQLPDFSLRSPTCCYTAGFSTTFFIYAKTFFAHLITSAQKFKNFDFILQKKFRDLRQNGKRARTQLAPPVPGQAYCLR